MLDSQKALPLIQTVQCYPLVTSFDHFCISGKSSSSSEHLSPLSDTPHELKGSFLNI